MSQHDEELDADDGNDVIWKRCFTCRDYANRRRDAIAEPLTAKAWRENRDIIEVVDEFMLAAHDRHMKTGEPLLPGGPTEVIDPYISRMAALLSPGLFGNLFTEADDDL